MAAEMIIPLRAQRSDLPSHFLLEINSFSILKDKSEKKYDSGVFEAGGQKWRLCLYPKGDEKCNAKGYISLYLEIAETETYHTDWEVYVDCKLFVYNYMCKEYHTFQETGGKLWRFHKHDPKWGFAKLITLKEFEDERKGFMKDDTCLFGAEINVVNAATPKIGTIGPKTISSRTVRGSEALSLVMDPHGPKTFKWKIKDLYNSGDLCYQSENYEVGGVRWYMNLFPLGYKTRKGKYLSVYLAFGDWRTLPSRRSVFAEYTISIVNKRWHKRSIEETDSYWFNSTNRSWGWGDFIKLGDLRGDSNGFIVNDSLTVTLSFSVVSIVKVPS